MHSMNYLGSLFTNMKVFYNEINGATLTGAIDVVVVEQDDGSFTCSPFHVRFGKLGVLRSRLKMVDLELNGEPLNIHMKLGESGEAFFVEEIPEDQLECSAHLATSPIPDSNFSLYQENVLPPRRNSADFLDKYQNQVSDYTHRRYTDGQGAQKTDFSAQKREYQKRKENAYGYVPATDTIGQDQDAMFIMDDLDDPSQDCNFNEKPSTVSGTAKMFHAEEVNDKDSRAKEAVRKISINNDFKPISLAKEEPNLPPTLEAKQNVEEPVNIQIEDAQKTQNNGNGNKKKKKTKKSGSKKKNSQRKSSASSSNGYSSQSELAGVDPSELEKFIERNIAGEISAIPSYVASNHNQDLHFFSDTDIVTSKIREPGCCRDTPVQSDSELEIARGSGAESDSKAGMGQSWRWGELPSPLPVAIPNVPLKQPAAAGSLSSDDETTKLQTKDELTAASPTQGHGSSSMLSGMFNFMKPSRGTVQPATTGSEGLYLAELADGVIDPEVAALYFPPHQPGSQTSMPHNISGSMAVDISGAMATEEDYESGNGPSLPQSPSSIEGALCKGIDSDEDDFKIFSKGYVGLSLCGPSILDQPTTSLVEAFERDAVRFEMLCSDPMLVQNPRLVVRLGDKFMPWSTAAPILLSLIVYHRPLPKSVLQSMTSGVHGVREGKMEEAQNTENKTVQRSGIFPWNWRRSAEKQTPGEVNVDSAKLSVNTSLDANQPLTEQQILSADTEEKLCISDPSQEAINVADPNIMKMLDPETPEDECVAVSTQTSFPSLTGVAGGGYSGSQSSEESDEGASLEKGHVGVHQPHSHPVKHSTDKFRKTLRLSSEQIESLNLREGMNEMVFSVTTAYQGTSRCKCHVFRWRHDDKIVISDIDGTITKSDVLGHIFPMVGKDWAQSGVAQLFTKIKNNGYKILYLSARAIGQARLTREYLRSIKQGDLSLPDGPLLLNPTSLLRAFHREVIVKKPEEFKIQCMSDIMALFPADCKPFYAGYGNRVNDVWAYQAVGIPIVRIFTINYKGELKHELTQTFQSSYSNMSYIVDHLFPPVRGEVCEDFSQFVYWREPVAHLPEILPPVSSHTLPSIPEGPADH